MAVVSPARVPALVLLTAGLLLARPAGAGDPSLTWRTITTPHFYVHYYENVRGSERAMAQRVARTCEKAHEVLTPFLRHIPTTRTHVVVTDDTDGANGSAQILPMNIIRLYLSGPGSLSSLNDYDDMLYGLILHEYTHILHIDTIHGVARIINLALGKTYAPNQVQPRWLIEGYAVYSESQFTAGGRNRNSLYDMYLRAAVVDGRVLELDNITSSTRIYPRGTVPYLYGSRFIQYIADRLGRERLMHFSHNYGGSTIPYGLNRVAKQELGRTFVELYDDFKRHLERKYALQVEQVRRRGLTPFRKVTDDGEGCHAPRYSRDGTELVFVDSDGRSHTAIKVLDARTGRVKESYDSYGGRGVDFSPDGRYLVYGQGEYWRTFYRYDDLYVRDRRTGETRRLTHGLRAREPAVSPDGTRVAFATSELGTMNLCVMPFDGGEHRVVYAGQRGDQIYTPRWSPDGRQLIYSRWRKGGNRDIYLLELATGKQRRLTDDRALDIDPSFSADGKRVYFSSDRTGIYNIYCLALESGELRQVSNVIDGALSPTVAPDERTAHYIGFSYKGYDLHAMELDRDAYLPALPYVNARPEPPEVEPGEPYPERPYSPWLTLLPRAWSFVVSSDSFGSVLGINFTGGDVTLRHRYSLAANVSATEGHVSYGLSYAYDRFWPGLRLSTSRYVGPRGGLEIDGQSRTYIEENYGFGASVSLPVLRVPNHSGNVSVGYRLNWLRDGDETRVLVEPDQLSPRLPDTGILAGATLGLSYYSLQRYAQSISIERGRSISLSLRVDHPGLGSDYASTAFSWTWREYIPMPWADLHVLALRLAGGIASGNLSRRGVWSIGGFPEQDVLMALFDSTRVAGAYLRGYPRGAVYGDQYHLLNAEYRLPVLDIERGFSTLPLYFTHLHVSAFVDVGNAFFGEMDFGELRVGVGAEVMVEAVFGYFLPATFRVGYARGLMEDGGNQFHFLLGNSF